MKSRSATLRAVEGNLFDVCVIGAGATGAACALDSQLRGLNTVLVDAGDFAGATSSASTKIVHGGVRYLEQAIRNLDAAQYRVVRRALRERALMLQNGPYLSQAVEFLIPCFRWSEILYYGIGLKIYDWIARGARLFPSRFLNRSETLRRLPGLEPRALLGSIAYADGQFDDSRYNIALVATFAEAGGEALNYLRVTGFEKGPDGKLTSASVEDRWEQRAFSLNARMFINATGPFADTVRRLATSDALPRMRPSKGAHVVLPVELMPSDDALLIPGTEDGRILFVIPWQGRLVIGTTDEDVEIGEELHVTQTEVEYLLRHLNRYLAHPVGPDQIVSGFAGARPLLSRAPGRKTKDLSRDDELEHDARSGLLTIMGGKWTIHRAMAEQTIDAAQRYLGVPVTACLTSRHPLVGSRGYTPDYWLALKTDHGLSEATARHLASKFGTQAPEIIAIALQNPLLANPILPELASLHAEVAYSTRKELAMTIEDVLFRRIGIQLYSWRAAIQAAPAVAATMAKELEWSEEFTKYSVEQYVKTIHRFMQLAGLKTEPSRE